MSEKSNNFKRISKKRQKNIIELIKKLHNLTNKSFYEYNDSDIDNLFNPIELALNQEKEEFAKKNDVKDTVKRKLEDMGYNVLKSDKYSFIIEKNNNTKFIKVINTNGKYAHWKANKKDEEINNDLYYICVRNDGEYKYHIIPSYKFSEFIRKYHQHFISMNGNNGASDIREFLDKPSIHVPSKQENEYLDNWKILN